MGKTGKLSPRQKAKMIDKGLGLLDAFLKGAGKAKKKRSGGQMAGLVKPKGCGRCD